MQVASALFNWGIEEAEDYEIETNPAARIKRSKTWKTKSYKKWTDEQCAIFEKSGAPVHLLTAYFLTRYTGQRRGDILAMLRRADDPRLNEIKVKPSKTAKLSKTDDDELELTIPVHSRLRAHIDTRPNALMFVVDRRGQSFAEREKTFSKEFRAALNAAGLPQLHFHGLRHTAATALADAGCSAHQIMAITGTGRCRWCGSTRQRRTKNAMPRPRWLSTTEQEQNKKVPNLTTELPNLGKSTDYGRSFFVVLDQLLRSGEPGWDRTNDHLIKSQMLYR